MKRNSLVLILALLAAPSAVHASVLASGSFENGYSQFASNYGGSEIVADSTAPNGTHSLRFNFPAGFTAGNAPDIVTLVPEFFADQEEVYIQYYVKYSSNWIDNPGTNKMVYIWFGDIKNKPNLPVMGHSQWDTSGVWAVLQAGGTISEQVWHSYDYSKFNFTYGVWHKIVLRVKMNTGGNHNGVFQMWVDDVLRINGSNGYFRNSGDSYGITSFQMTPVYGGGGSPVPVTQYMWFDDVIIQTTPFGASSTQLGQPTPPSGLKIN
jgi:hypothetical protein